MAGKGSRRRGSTPEETKRYHEGWERIFGYKARRAALDELHRIDEEIAAWMPETKKPRISRKARK